MEQAGPMENTSTLAQASYWTAAAPLLCAVHCIVTPLLVLLSPAFRLNPAAEYALMAASVLLAVSFLIWGVRAHGRALVWLPVLAGMLVWIGGEVVAAHSHGGLWLHALGSTLLAGGLVWNAWLRHHAVCGACGCPAHEEEAEAIRAG